MVGFRAFALGSIAVACAAACSAFSGSSTDDGESKPVVDAGGGDTFVSEPIGGNEVRTEVTRKCAKGSPFGVVKPISFQSEDLAANGYAAPRLTDNELTMYISEDPPVDGGGIANGSGGKFQPNRILRTQRTDKNGAFDKPAEAKELLSDSIKAEPFIGLSQPWVSSVGDSVYYARLLQTGQEIWTVLRQSDLTWSVPVRVEIDDEAAFSHYSPFMIDDTRTTMLMSRVASGSLTDPDLYTSTRTRVGEPFPKPQPVDTRFATPGVLENFPVLSADGLELFFHRAKEDGSKQIYVVTREEKTGKFGDAALIDSTVLATTNQTPGWLSPDGCRLYYSEVDTLATPLKSVMWVRERAAVDAGN